MEAPVLWGRIAKYVLWKADQKWHARGWVFSIGGQHDNEHTLCGMMWADNCWIFSKKKKIDLHGERHHRGAVGPGHGALAGIVVVDKPVQTRGHEDLACGRQGPGLGSHLVRSLQCTWIPFSSRSEIAIGRGFKAPSAVCARP